MATVEEPRAAAEPFIRPDGKEKVTGLGRYTADLNLTGQLHAKFRYADHPHARIKSIDVSKARALPGVLAVLTHEDVPDVKYGGMVQDRRLFAKEKVLWEGDVVAGIAATTPEIAEQAAALVEIDYEPLPAVVDYEAATTDATHPRPRRLGIGQGQQVDGTRPQPDRLLDDREGRRRRRDGGRRRRCQGRYVADCSSGRAHRAPGDHRRVARRQGHGLVVDPGALRRPRRCRPHAADSRVERPHHRSPARRRLRRQVRLPLRGPCRRARKRCAPAGEARLLAPRGVRRGRPPARGHGHRARDRRPPRRDARRPPRPARARQGRLLRRRRLLRADGGDARLRPLQDRERQRRVLAHLLEHPALELDPRPDGAAGLLGRSSSTWTSSPARSTSIRSSCAGAR